MKGILKLLFFTLPVVLGFFLSYITYDFKLGSMKTVYSEVIKESVESNYRFKDEVLRKSQDMYKVERIRNDG